MSDTVTVIHEYDQVAYVTNDEISVAQVTNEVVQIALAVEQGLTGVTGATGATGATGPPGVDGFDDKNYVHNQLSASSVWMVAHNLGKFPAVMVVDSGNSAVIGDVQYVDGNNLTITFSSAFGGKCYCN